MVEYMTTAIETALKNCAISLGKWLVGGLVVSSYWICLYVCIIAFVFYIAGSRKAGRWATFSLIAYIIIQALGSLVL